MRALIATIPPGRGGVPAMLRTALALLAERGIEAEVAWYEPYGMTPRLSVPSYRLGTRRPSAERREVAGAAAGHALGAWLPELELTHYAPTRLWRQRIAAADLHLAVSGTALAARAFAATRTPFLAWLASDWHGDRKDRVARFPLARRALDRLVVAPVCRRLERRILRGGRILALSEATRRHLERIAGEGTVAAVLPPPIDTSRFRPEEGKVVPGRLGFVGRFDDPRKNLPLFLDALQAPRRRDPLVTALMVGSVPGSEVRRDLAHRGLDEAVEFVPYLEPEPLAELLRSCDLCVVTAHQEGLCIAALEAMAAGCPVVSTRCGGPEEFVRDGENGFLTGFDAAEIAARIREVVTNRDLRARLAVGARRTVEIGYSLSRARAILDRDLDVLIAAREGPEGA